MEADLLLTAVCRTCGRAYACFGEVAPDAPRIDCWDCFCMGPPVPVLRGLNTSGVPAIEERAGQTEEAMSKPICPRCGKRIVGESRAEPVTTGSSDIVRREARPMHPECYVEARREIAERAQRESQARRRKARKT